MFTDVAENYFSIDRTDTYPSAAPSNEILTATVTRPVPDALRGDRYAKSIRKQLLELHLANRSSSLEALLRGIKIGRRTLTVEQCPAIARRMKALRGMAVVLPGPEKPPPLHPIDHEIIVSVDGAYIKGTFTDPDISLVHWALDTLQDLQKCSG